MTQIESARKGMITDEMQFVAAREDLPAELIRDEVVRGRMVIPANTVHLQKRLGAHGHRDRGQVQDQCEYRQLGRHQQDRRRAR